MINKRLTKQVGFYIFLLIFSTNVGFVPRLVAADSVLDWPVISNDVPPPGEHPRILFSKKDIPALRKRAQSRIGKAIVQAMKWQIHSPATGMLKNEEKRKRGDKSIKPPHPDKLATYASICGMLYIITNDEQYAEIGNRIIDLYLELKGPVSVDPVPIHSRGTDEIALAYDWLYGQIPKKNRELLKKHFESWLDSDVNQKNYRKMGYLMGPVMNGRPCDWGAINAGGAAIAYCAIEGESEKIKKNALEPHLEMMNCIADYVIYPEGHMLSGNSYISGDFSDYFTGLMALKRRGINLFDHPHIKQIPTWLMYETVPGGWICDNRNQSRGYLHFSPTILSLANTQGGYANLLRDLATGPEKNIAHWWAVGLVFGNFNQTAPEKVDLPLSFYSSSMGTVFSRSGWGADASAFTLTMEPPAGGHTHPDKGSFTFYANQQALAADSGVSHFRADDHNTVLIDGKGQHRGQGRTDAVVEVQLASALADITQMDVKPAYEQFVDYTNKTKEKVIWCDLKFNKGLPFRWNKTGDYEKIDRSAIFIRSEAGAYAVVLDDVKKDDQAHKYTWLLNSAITATENGPRSILFKDRFAGEYVESVTGKPYVVFNGEITEPGEYNIWALAHTRPDLLQTHWYFHYYIGKYGGHRTYLHHHLRGWEWVQLKKTDKVGPWALKTGELQIKLGVRKGGRFAKVIATKNLDYNPNFSNKTGSKAIVPFALAENSFKKGWKLGNAPEKGMELHFLQPEKDKLSYQINPKPKQAYLTQYKATLKAVSATFAAVMIPFKDGTPKMTFKLSQTSPGQATVARENSIDYLFTNGEGKGPIKSDASFAMVRVVDKMVVSYLMVDGSMLSWNDHELVRCKRPLTLVNDGDTCLLDAAEGVDVEFDRLEAKAFVCNRWPVSTSIRWFWKELDLIEVPHLANDWDIQIADDGKTVFVTGKGPEPLKIHAPKARKCMLNNVSVFFSRDGAGNIYPKTGLVHLTHGNDPVE